MSSQTNPPSALSRINQRRKLAAAQTPAEASPPADETSPARASVSEMCKLTIRITPELSKRLNIALAHEGRNKQALLTDLITGWLADVE